MSEGSPTEEFGPYIVYERLGIGGMAQVHRAVATNGAFQRPIALKRMLSHIAGSEEMVKSFVREARLARYLRHENVAQTYDLGRVGEIYFIVMELITGRNLREVLRHCGTTTGPMPVQIALNILNQICDALDYAHNLCDEHGKPLGIIHRDVSPSNVIVSDTGVVKLIDFGIAKASGMGMQTIGGTLKGKFAYIAPEYIAGKIDARADLFAVGVIAHELLTNRPLFSGRDDIDTLTRVRDMHIDPPSKHNPLVPPEIDDIVMTALARDPERRWQHATALRTALTTLTRRLDLVATNQQMIEWLDATFGHAQEQTADLDTDTDTDGELFSNDDGNDVSISFEPRAANPPSMTQKITLVMRDRAPEPPTKTPLGTPSYMPAQRSSVRALSPGAAAPAADDSHAAADRNSRPSGLALRGSNAAAPPVARPSASDLARAEAVSTPPVVVPARSSPVSPPAAAPAPAARSLHPSPRASQSFAAVPAALNFHPSPAAQGFHPAPTHAAQSFHPTPAAQSFHPPNNPAAQNFDADPFATLRPSASSLAAPLPYDPAQSAVMQHDFAQPGSTPSTETAARTWRSILLVVVLVVLVAATAGLSIYFLLPLLT